MIEAHWNDSITQRQYAYLSASGLVDPQLISDGLAIQPDRVFKLGDPIPNKHSSKTVRRRKSHWRLDSQLADTEPLDEHVNALLRRVTPHKDRLLDLQEHFQFEIVCVCTGGNFSFSTTLEMQRLATACGITFWFDIYPDTGPHEEIMELRDQLNAALSALERSTSDV